jgi:hypothetical protein
MLPAMQQQYTSPQLLREALWNAYYEKTTLQTADDDLFPTEIHDAEYKPVDVKQVVESCTHLTDTQRAQLLHLLQQFPKLFDGKLKQYTGRPIHLDIDPKAVPVHASAYPIANLHLPVYKKELYRLVDIGVLVRCGASRWASPLFIIAKKDGTVRWITDFRALNRALIRRKYPLPVIHEILARRSGYRFFTKLDISMQYYTFALDEESSYLCVIVTPFGKFRYVRLPMGISQSPDLSQEIMDELLQDLEDVEAYIDDIGCFSNTWEEHLQTLFRVLSRLESHGFTIHPEKCEWAVQETDWLGHWLTPVGIKPWPKKVKAILNLQPPTNLKQLRSFIGAVSYYRNMWPRRSHILAPLTSLTGTTTFQWGPEQQAAFEQMRAIVASDALLYYPNHNLPFHIETDASESQLGAVIKQNGHPVAYYSRKLTPAQQNYTVIEKELLSIVMTLKTFRSMLLGAELYIYTDHRNLTFELTKYTTQRVLRWRLFLE